METKTVKLSQIKPNPSNPRLIKDDKFNKLVQSLKDFPEMTEIRPIVVNKEMVILGGNMRFKAMKEAGWKECPVNIVELTEEQEKEFIVKDNVGFGDWDRCLLERDFDKMFLDKCGLEFESSVMSKQFERDINEDAVSIKYPITFFATEDEYNQWVDLCDELGIESDTKALFKLIKTKLLC